MALNVEADAEALQKAMKGIGANDKVLIEIIANRPNDHLQRVRDAYEKKFGRSLNRDIDSETSGPYQEALLGLLFTPAEYDVRCLHNAMKGTGCDEEVFLEHLTHRTAAEMVAIEEKYLSVIGRMLVHDLKSETGGDIEKFFVMLIEGTKKGGAQSWTEEDLKRDAGVLYKAGEGRFGADDVTFINILTSRGTAYIKQLDDLYAKHSGDTLAGVVEKEFGGILKKGLLAIMADGDEYYAKRIDKALTGIGSDDASLVRILVSQRSHLAGINEAHKRLTNMTLRHRIESEVGGDLGKLLISITTGI